MHVAVAAQLDCWTFPFTSFQCYQRTISFLVWQGIESLRCHCRRLCYFCLCSAPNTRSYSWEWDIMYRCLLCLMELLEMLCYLKQLDTEHLTGPRTKANVKWNVIFVQVKCSLWLIGVFHTNVCVLLLLMIEFQYCWVNVKVLSTTVTFKSNRKRTTSDSKRKLLQFSNYYTLLHTELKRRLKILATKMEIYWMITGKGCAIAMIIVYWIWHVM